MMAKVGMVGNDHEIPGLQQWSHASAGVRAHYKLAAQEWSNIAEEVVEKGAIAFEVVDTAAEGKHIATSDLAKDEISSMTNCSG